MEQAAITGGEPRLCQSSCQSARTWAVLSFLAGPMGRGPAAAQHQPHPAIGREFAQIIVDLGHLSGGRSGQLAAREKDVGAFVMPGLVPGQAETRAPG